MSPPSIALSTPISVLGAGVTGLTVATSLHEAGFTDVTVVARDFPAPAETILLLDRDADPGRYLNYASPWAGAHNRWVPPPPRDEDGETPEQTAFRNQLEAEHAFSLATFARMEAVAAAHPDAGVTFCPGIEYVEAPGPAYAALTEARAGGDFFSAGAETVPAAGPGIGPLPGFRLLRADELPDRVVWGCTYRTWCANPMVYCAWLLRRFVSGAGYKGGQSKVLGKIVRRGVGAVEEVFALGLGAQVVVNCSGVGFADDKVVITRGQTVLVSNPCAATVTRQYADGSWSFSVPRFFSGGTIVGGTKEVGDWEPRPRPETRTKLLRDFAETWPAILDFAGEADGKGDGAAVDPEKGFRVVGDVVGRRPTRQGGIRLEKEILDDGKKTIVHAYGLGGRGYELSWGVAGRVVALLSSA